MKSKQPPPLPFESTALALGAALGPPFRRRLTALSVLFGTVELLAGLAFAEPALLVSSGLTFAFGFLLYVAGHLGSDRPQTTATVVAVGIDALALAGAALVPDVGAALAFLPVLSLILLLPSVVRFPVAWLFGITFALTGAVLALSLAQHPLPSLRAPLNDLFGPSITVGVVALLVAFIADAARQLKGAFDALRSALARQQAIFERSLDPILLVNDVRVFTDVNAAAERFLGVPRERIVGRPMAQFLGSDAGRSDADWGRLLIAGEVRLRTTVRRPDGTTRVIDAASTANVTVGEHLTVWRDVTDDVRAEAERALLAAAISEAADGIAILDAGGRVTYANPAFAREIELADRAAVGARLADVIGLIEPAHSDRVVEAASRAANHDETWRGEVVVTANGGHRTVALTISPIRGESDTAPCVLVIGRDMTHMREVEAAVETASRQQRAMADGLRNLRPLHTVEATAQAICDTAVRLPGFDFAGLYACGVGDHVDVLALSGVPIPADAFRQPAWAATLRRRAAGPWVELTANGTDRAHVAMAGAGVIGVGASSVETASGHVGVLVVGTKSPEVAARMDEELPAVVQLAASTASLIGAALDARRDTDAIRRHVARVIETRAFRSVFQPIVDLREPVIIGYEALTRFHDGTPPDQMFARARDAGVGPALEVATIEAALEAAGPLPANRFLDINLSPRMILQVEPLRTLLRAYGFGLVLEITEHERVDDYAALRAAVNELGDNVRLGVDDAGAGYASLRHILELRPAIVKLDLGLVRGIDQDPVRQALVAGMADFGRRLETLIVAEGIETEAERAELLNIGITAGQGYLFQRPVPIEELLTGRL